MRGKTNVIKRNVEKVWGARYLPKIRYLIFLPRIIRHSRNNQRYALNCTTPFFYVLAPTCFSSSLPSSGSLLDPSELLEKQIKWVVYHIMCSYVAFVPERCGSISWEAQQMKPRHSSTQAT
jgi:hypothetical protein